MNYFELYPGDYLRDTTRLSLVDHGAYMRLLMAYYGEEQPLPASYDDLYIIVSAVKPTDRQAVSKVADRYFPIGDDGMRHNSRVDVEIAKAQKRIQIARENGAKNKARKDPLDDPLGMPVGRPPGKPPATQRVTRSGEALHTPHATTPPCGVQDTPAEPAAPVGAAGGHDDVPRETPNPAARHAIALNRAGFRCTSINPDLIAFVEAGGTVEHLLETASLPDCSGKPANYVIRTARREHSERASPVGDRTHASRQGLVDTAAARAAKIFTDAESRGGVVAGDDRPLQPPLGVSLRRSAGG